MLRQLEDAYIRAALTRTQFNKKEAAKLLGMGRTTLVEKLRRRNLAARSAVVDRPPRAREPTARGLGIRSRRSPW